MTKIELLRLIGDGAYGSDIPNDDPTNGLLSELMDDGLVGGEQSRIDDFFYLTAAGKVALSNGEST